MRKTLSDPKATEQARKLYEYLCSIEGKGILAGQQECPAEHKTGSEMRYLKAVTGTLPAIRGMDYIHNDFDRVNRRAKDWHKQGGIVSICYHWGTPPDGIGYRSSLGTVDLETLITSGTELHDALLSGMDRVAEALKQLQNARVPVLWRPFHEFDGGWFWWGKGGGDVFIRLWRLMYDRFVHHHGLHNLIWVLGYDGEVKDGWYPGDDYVDIVGADTYKESVPVSMYHRLEDAFGNRFLKAYHECGPIPEPDELTENNRNWIWFLTWHTIHIRKQNSKEKVRRIYQHPYVITLDKLPWRR